MTIDETADAMGLAQQTVNRLWVAARAWLQRELTRAAGTRSLTPDA